MTVNVKQLIQDILDAAVNAKAQGQDWLGFIPSKEFHDFMWSIITELDAAGHTPNITKTPDGGIALAIPTTATVAAPVSTEMPDVQS